MVSPAQQTFVEQALSSSAACWKVLLQQVMLMQWRIPAVPSIPVVTELFDGIPDAPGVINDGGNSTNGDAWDGYPAERSRLYRHLRDNDLTDLVVLTGDIHTTWAAELTEKPFLSDVGDPLYYDPTGLTGLGVRPLGVEFVCPSITSDNFDEILIERGFPAEGTPAAVAALEVATLAENLHIKSVDLENHGYSIVDIDAERTVCDTFFVPHLAPADGETFHESWEVRKSGPDEVGHRLIARDGPAPSRTGVPEAPSALPEADETEDPTTVPVVPDTTGGSTLPATGGGGSLLVGGAAAALATVIARRASAAGGGQDRD